MRKLVLLLSVCSLINGLSAQSYNTIDILNPDTTSLCSFGWAVAIEGDHLFVTETCFGIGMSSRVHVFHRNAGGPNAWGPVQLIVAPDGDDNGFGTGLKLKDDILAIGRPQHEYDSLGTTLCREGTIFFYSLSDTSTWELTNVAGGANIEVTTCFAQHPVVVDLSSNAAGIGHYFGLTMFSSHDGTQWQQIVHLPALMQALFAIHENRLFAATGEYTIMEYDTTGAEVGPVTTDLKVYGGAHQLKVSGGDLVLAQPGGQFVNYSEGRLLLIDIDGATPSILDEFSFPGTSFFGEAIATSGTWVAALEGHYHEPLGNRVFLLKAMDGSLVLDVILDGIEEEIYTYERRLYLSSTGDIVYSTVTEKFMLRTVRLYVRDTNVGLDTKPLSELPIPVIEGDLLLLTNVDRDRNDRIHLFNSMGSLVGITDLEALSNSGYNIGGLTRGIYFGSMMEQQKQFKFVVH